MSGNIKVVVRCRPLNSREKARNAPCLIRMEGNKTILSKPVSPGSQVLEDPKAFTFDQSYWSADKDDINYADQEHVYNDLGRELLDHAFDGYNCCIFAYKGIIPRTCHELFERVASKRTDLVDFQVEVSYIEIYNEKVRDLLNPSNKANLKVREHPVLGPYVQDLSRLAVNSFENIDHLMDEGNKARTIAATNMNATSSRSHGVFTIFVTQKITDPNTKQVTDKVARISLVDLAGSERANSTGATGARLKEGANINKSLTTLGKVIAGLAEQSSIDASKKTSKKPKDAFIPFRDSVLTWLLKDSLGGNSKTCMIAAISPADYDETLSTLRYADQAKKIKTKAVINEDPNAKAMRELKDEVEALRQALMVYAPEEVEKIQEKAHPTTKKKPASATPSSTPSINKPTKPNLSPASAASPTSSKSTVVFTDASGNTTQLTKEEMVDQLQMTEKLLSDLNKTWEEKLQTTEKIHVERENTLTNLGITVEKNQVGLYTPKEIPYLINLNEDPLMSECLMYNIKPGRTNVDKFEVDEEDVMPTAPQEKDQTNSVIRLSGSNINKDHCYFENVDNIVTLYPHPDCTTMVNGRRITEPKRLKSGYRIILGDYHVFRFNNPSEAKKERDIIIQQQQQQENEPTRADSPCTPTSPTYSESKDGLMIPPVTEVMDWNFARREAMLNSYISDTNFNNLTDEDLDKLFDDVAKVRVIRKRQSASSETLSRRTSSSSSFRRSTYSSVFMDDLADSDYTTDASTVSSSSSARSSIGENYFMMSKEEQEIHMEQHRRKYQAKLRRLSRRLSYAPPIAFTPREKELASKAVTHWRRKRNVTMAKAILMHDVHVRQANEMALKAGKNVFYQFAVVHDTMSATAVSHWENNHGTHHQKNTLDADLIKTPKPCIAIQVIDAKHQSVYLWSLEKFLARLRYLQGAYFASDSKKHMKGEDLFYESEHPPAYTLVGLAKVPLRNLATQVPMESTVSVFCRNTGEKMADLRVLIAPIARSVRHPYRSSASSVSSAEDPNEPILDDENPRSLLHVGQQLVFEVSIIDLGGLDPRLFSRVHAQFRLSTFGSNLEGVFASEAKEYTYKGTLEFNYHQTLSMAITQDILTIIKTKDITFEIYGQPSKHYLEQTALSINNNIKLAAEADTPPVVMPVKKAEDVIARIQICELTPEGDYKPVPVESAAAHSGDVIGQNDTFSLQQGQQRRVVISLQNASLDKIMDMRIGRIRLMDNKQRILESPLSIAEVPLNMVSNNSNKDGICIAQGSWDSSLHDTLLLNAVTPVNQRVVMCLSWTVRQKMLLNGNEVDVAVRFEKDLFVTIKDQNKAATIKKKTNPNAKRGSVILNFFSLKSNLPIKHQITSLFVVEYRPELFGGVLDLPLADLPAQVLGTYERQRLAMMKREETESMHYAVQLKEQLDRLCGPGAEKNQPKSPLTEQTVLDLWTKTFDGQQALTNPAKEALVKPVVRRWVPYVHQIMVPAVPEEGSRSKRGYLMRKNDGDSKEWDRYWCILMG
ncbi:hypothetical protein EDC96DRAFT_553728 [Choanephora cucurbitarum]|nr:hypothetical protein EDC96DRAFT_553728 [Choanephora cucurbitarum]